MNESPCVSTSTPVVVEERPAQCAAMLGQRVCVGTSTQLLQEPRRALDVGEDKRDGSGRKLARHTTIQPRRTARCRILAGAVIWRSLSVDRKPNRVQVCAEQALSERAAARCAGRRDGVVL
jgi:hypothetical protein